MKYDQKSRRRLPQAAFVLTGLLSAAAPALAQDNGKPAVQKWRPKDGTYASRAKDHMSCGEFGDLILGLKENSIDGHEWGCKIIKLRDTAPGTLTVDASCTDIEEDYPKPYKATILLKRIDDKTILYGFSSKKFKGRPERLDYCPEDTQRMYTEANAKSRAEAELKAAAERSRPKSWRPRDGVYANTDADFNDRCQKFGDAIIELDEGSISSGTDKCTDGFINDTAPDAIEIRLVCNQAPNTPGLVVRSYTANHLTYEPVGSEMMTVKKVDDKTIFLRKTKYGKFIEPGEQLSYCGPDVQRTYARQKAKK